MVQERSVHSEQRPESARPSETSTKMIRTEERDTLSWRKSEKRTKKIKEWKKNTEERLEEAESKWGQKKLRENDKVTLWNKDWNNEILK
jgi:hypothetical protein